MVINHIALERTNAKMLQHATTCYSMLQPVGRSDTDTHTKKWVKFDSTRLDRCFVRQLLDHLPKDLAAW
jgi:hypothetical protein